MRDIFIKIMTATDNINIFNTLSPTQEVSDEITRQHGVSLFIKREDLNHPEIMGNKLRKLKYNIIEATQQNVSTLLSFGGAYSNHILALSAAGRIFGLNTIGIIRGEELANKPLNPVLAMACKNGMKLNFISRSAYQKKTTIEFIDLLNKTHGEFYLIPEGGSNDLAIKGATEILDDINGDYDVITCPCGTGGTVAGIIKGVHLQRASTNILGFQVLNADHYIEDAIHSFLPAKTLSQTSWTINSDFHFGGYAKTNNKLLTFIKWFKQTHNIELDFIYTGKMMFGLYNLIQTGYFRKGSRLLAIHTGGTQTANVE